VLEQVWLPPPSSVLERVLGRPAHLIRETFREELDPGKTLDEHGEDPALARGRADWPHPDS